MIVDLSRIVWKEYKLGDIFVVESCKCSNVSDLSSGSVPYVGATNRNNGVLSFVRSDLGLVTPGNCIAFICDGEGSVGLSVYKNEDFIGSTTVKVGRSPFLNKYVGLFMTTVADSVRNKYNFGFKRNRFHLSNEILLLPSVGHSPDYSFMESYMKDLEKRKVETYLAYISKRIARLKDFKGVELHNRKRWGEFIVSDLFNVKIGKSIDKNKVNNSDGLSFYITRKESFNGVDGFIDYDEGFKNHTHPVITIGNETAEPFVQAFPFFTGTKVNILSPLFTASVFSLRFIATCLRSHKTKFSYSFTVNSTRLKRLKIMLPVNSKGVPDYEYMENYIKKIEYLKLKEYVERKSLSL